MPKVVLAASRSSSRIVLVLAAALLAPLAAVPCAHAVTRTGVLQIAHGHEPGSWRSTHTARLGSRRLDLRAAGEPGVLAHRFGGRRVRLTGTVRRDGMLRVRSVRRAGDSSTGGPRARAAHVLSGAKTTVVILFGFADGPAMTRTAEQARTAFFTGATSLRAYVQEISGGGATLTGLAGNADGDVIGPLTITPSAGRAPSDGACEEFHWMSLARQAALAAGTDVRQYDRVLYVSADAAPCTFSGEAPVSSSPLGKGTWIYLNDTFSAGVAAHEWGHTYGLMHAASTRCRSDGANVAISSSCTDTEYGDPFDAMGMGSPRWFQAFNRVALGLLPAAGGTATASAGGRYVLGALAQSSAGLRMLRVPRPDGTYLGVELRKPYGLFETWSASAPVVNGATVRILPGSYTCCGEPLTRLVDTHPSTTTFDDAPLAPGESLTDPGSQATVSVVSVATDTATVDVAFPGDPRPVADPATPPATTTPAPPATTTPPLTTTSPVVSSATPATSPATSASAASTETAVPPVAKPEPQVEAAPLRVALVRRAARSVLIRVRPGLPGPWTIKATGRRGGRTIATRTIRNVRSAATVLRLTSRSRLRGATLTVATVSATGTQRLRRRL